MAKQARWLGRSIVVVAVGIGFGLAGVVGSSVAQTDGMKKDGQMTGDTMKTGDTMMKSSDTMKGDMKADDMKKDGKAMMKDEKMMPSDKPMEKKQ